MDDFVVAEVFGDHVVIAIVSLTQNHAPLSHHGKQRQISPIAPTQRSDERAEPVHTPTPWHLAKPRET